MIPVVTPSECPDQVMCSDHRGACHICGTLPVCRHYGLCANSHRSTQEIAWCLAAVVSTTDVMLAIVCVNTFCHNLNNNHEWLWGMRKGQCKDGHYNGAITEWTMRTSQLNVVYIQGKLCLGGLKRTQTWYRYYSQQYMEGSSKERNLALKTLWLIITSFEAVWWIYSISYTTAI